MFSQPRAPVLLAESPCPLSEHFSHNASIYRVFHPYLEPLSWAIKSPWQCTPRHHWRHKVHTKYFFLESCWIFSLWTDRWWTSSIFDCCLCNSSHDTPRVPQAALIPSCLSCWKHTSTPVSLAVRAITDNDFAQLALVLEWNVSVGFGTYISLSKRCGLFIWAFFSPRISPGYILWMEENNKERKKRKL